MIIEPSAKSRGLRFWGATMKGRHPSGRPIRRREVKYLSIPRPVRDEPMSPGLRTEFRTEAIGFHHGWEDEEDD